MDYYILARKGEKLNTKIKYLSPKNPGKNTIEAKSLVFSDGKEIATCELVIDDYIKIPQNKAKKRKIFNIFNITKRKRL